MAEEIEWFVGIDWARQSHQVCLVDARATHRSAIFRRAKSGHVAVIVNPAKVKLGVDIPLI